MQPDSTGPALPPSRLLALAGALLIVVTTLAGLFAILNLREAAIARSRREMTKLGVVLAEQTARSLQAVDIVLKDVQSAAAARLQKPEQFDAVIGTEDVHHDLEARLKNLPQAQGIGLIDAAGRLVNASRVWPAPPLDSSDRAFFTYLREHDNHGVIIDQPVVSRLTGARLFPLARRIDCPGGRFCGVAIGVIEIKYIEQFYRAIASPGGSIALLRSNGTMLARYPRADAMIGEKLSPASPFYPLVKAGGGTAVTPGYIDGHARIVSIHPLRDLPLAIAVTISQRAALASWRRDSRLIAIGAICAAVGFALLFWMLAAQSRSLERQARELRESEERFRDYALTSSDYFWETDTEHRFTSRSQPGFGTQTASRNIAGRTRIELASDAAAEPAKWEHHYATLNAHQPFRDFVYTGSFGTDRERTIAVSGKPLFAASGGFLGYRGTVREITDQVRAEQALREAKAAAEAANLAKSQFLANMSHELRTPLNAIVGFSELIGLGMAGRVPPKIAEYIRLIHQSGKHLLDIINAILDLTKVDAGKLELREEAGIDLRQVADTCLALVRERAETGGVRIATRIDPQLPPVVADNTRLTEILLNLLTNAIKFTRPGGKVTIRIERSAAGGIDVAVEDTGCGMSAAEIEVALEPFGQVDSSIARRHEGAGLGLPLARRLAEMHGGRLRVDSEKGRGTTVTVTLPATRVIQAPAPAAAAAA